MIVFDTTPQMVELNSFDAQEMPKFGYKVICDEGVYLATEGDYLSYVDDLTETYLGCQGLF